MRRPLWNTTEFWSKKAGSSGTGLRIPLCWRCYRNTPAACVRWAPILISYRARFLKGLGEAATRFHREFSGGRETLEIPYRTVSTVEDPFAPLSALEQALLTHLDSHHGAELESAQCLTGPHKDDFDASLDGLSLKSYGSQGQTRTAAISLKLAQRELAGETLGRSRFCFWMTSCPSWTRGGRTSS